MQQQRGPAAAAAQHQVPQEHFGSRCPLSGVQSSGQAGAALHHRGGAPGLTHVAVGVAGVLLRTPEHPPNSSLSLASSLHPFVQKTTANKTTLRSLRSVPNSPPPFVGALAPMHNSCRPQPCVHTHTNISPQKQSRTTLLALRADFKPRECLLSPRTHPPGRLADP